MSQIAVCVLLSSQRLSPTLKNNFIVFHYFHYALILISQHSESFFSLSLNIFLGVSSSSYFFLFLKTEVLLTYNAVLVSGIWHSDSDTHTCCASTLSRVWPFVTPWTVDRQAPLSIGILQARILEWVTISYSTGSSQSRDQTQVSHIAGGLFTIWDTREDLGSYIYIYMCVYIYIYIYIKYMYFFQFLFPYRLLKVLSIVPCAIQ